MRTAFRVTVLLIVATVGALPASAHPGSSIAVLPDGTIYFVDTGGGVFSIEKGGRVVRREGPAFHWFAFDAGSRFRQTPWPRLPGAEIHSAGANPTIVLSSDFPVVIGTDGNFYYPDGSGGVRIRLTAITPSGNRSVRATLPAIRRRGETITWLNGLAAARDGALYYSEDRAIRRVDPRGQVTTIVDPVAVPDCAPLSVMEPGLGAYLRGLAIAADGSIYVAATGCGAVVRIDPRGKVSNVLKAEAPWSPTAVATRGSDVYVLEYLHTASDDRREWFPRVRKLTKDGVVTTIYTKRSRS